MGPNSWCEGTSCYEHGSKHAGQLHTILLGFICKKSSSTYVRQVSNRVGTSMVEITACPKAFWMMQNCNRIYFQTLWWVASNPAANMKVSRGIIFVLLLFTCIELNITWCPAADAHAPTACFQDWSQTSNKYKRWLKQKLICNGRISGL